MRKRKTIRTTENWTEKRDGKLHNRHSSSHRNTRSVFVSTVVQSTEKLLKGTKVHEAVWHCSESCHEVQGSNHTLSTASRHLPPNCQNDYVTKGALCISARLSPDVVRKIWVLIRLWRHPHKLETHPPWGKNSSFSIQMILVLFVIV